MAYRGEVCYNLSGTPARGLGGATVEQSGLEGVKLQVGNRYRIDFVAKGVAGGAVPWTPAFRSEVENGLLNKGFRVRVVNVTPGTFTPTSGSQVLDTISDWVPGASSVLPSRDLYGNFTFSMDIDILGKVGEDYNPDFNLGLIPVGYAIGIGIVAAVVALSVIAPSILVKAVRMLGKVAAEAAGAVAKTAAEAAKGLVSGLGVTGVLAVGAGIYLWMKYSKKGQAAKARYFG